MGVLGGEWDCEGVLGEDDMNVGLGSDRGLNGWCGGFVWGGLEIGRSDDGGCWEGVCGVGERGWGKG